jgi:hypothetical protein
MEASSKYTSVSSTSTNLTPLIIASEIDRKNPLYSDACIVDTGNICTYCCIVQIATCSRDMRACNPVYHKDFSPLLIMLSFILSVTLGCKIISLIISCLIKWRCFKVILH